MYPYDYRSTILGINHRLIFVVMPFAPHFDKIYKDLIKPAADELNSRLHKNNADSKYFAYRTKDDLKTSSGWINVMKHLFTAQIVLGVLTSDNANVFYELGIAHATQPIRRQILIARKDYEPKFDTKDLIYYEYDPNGLKGCIPSLATRMKNAIDEYNIEKEQIVAHARMKIGPNDFEVLMRHGEHSHFAVHSNDPVWKAGYEVKYGSGSFRRHVEGINNLCSYGLIGLNTKSVLSNNNIRVEFSYWWTSLGNDVLRLMDLIKDDELKSRRENLPEFFEKFTF